MLRARFIRHGKAASLLAVGEYDALSPIGAEQSERLGAWLAGQGVGGFAVFVGPRKRHSDTYAEAARACAARGAPLAAATVVPELDEHDAVGLVTKLLPVLASQDPGVSALMMAVARGEKPSEEQMLATFKGVAKRWVGGELDHAEVETWAAFRARVARAMAIVAAGAKEAAGALVFTSAGVVASSIGVALGLTDAKTLDLTVVPYNGSVTDLELTDDGWELRAFNATPHLPEARLVTRI